MEEKVMKKSYNKKVMELCSDIPSAKPNWDDIFSALSNKSFFPNLRSWDIGTLTGLIAEYHLRAYIQNKIQDNKLGFKVEMETSGMKTVTKQFFQYSIRDGIADFYDYFKNTKKQYTELPLCINVDSIPAFFDIAIRSYSSNSGRKGLKKKTSKNTIEKILVPIRSFFGSEFTYVFS